MEFWKYGILDEFPDDKGKILLNVSNQPMSYFLGRTGISALIMGSVFALSIPMGAIATTVLLAQGESSPTAPASPPPQNQPPFELNDLKFWSDQCLALEQTRQYTEALAACEKAIALRPNADNLDLWMARSNALFALRRYTDAVVSYRRILTIQPQSSFALTQQCAALFRLGQSAEAIDACENALQINGDWGTTTPATAWYYRGLAFTNSDRWQDALDSFNRARAINPNDLLTQAERCQALATLGQDKAGDDPCGLTAAVADYERALAANPDDDLPWFRQGIVLMQLRQEQRALTSFDRVLQIKPNASMALAYRCTIFNHQDQYEQALVACNAALQGDGIWSRDSAIAWSQQSHALIGLEQYAAALEAAQRATDIRPDYAEAWNNRGVSHWQLGEYEQAIADLTQATTINPQYTQAWYNQGRAYSSSKEYSQAVQSYCQALYQSDPNPSYCSGVQLRFRLSMQQIEPLIRSDVLTNLAAALWQLNHNSIEALAATDAALSLNPRSFTASYNQGLVLDDLGRYSEALVAYQTANCLYPQQPPVLTGIGRNLARQGRVQEALNIIETALSIDPQYTPALSELPTLLNSVGRHQANSTSQDSQPSQDWLSCPVKHTKPNISIV